MAEQLLTIEPSSALWQPDRIVSSFKVGELAEVMGDRDEVRRRCAAALAVARELAAVGRLAPVDAWMPGELEKLLAALDG